MKTVASIENAGNEGAPVTREAILDLLRAVYDPELQYNIVDLGLIYGVKIEADSVRVQMTLTTPGCPYGPALVEQVRTLLGAVRGIREVKIDVVWDPTWGPERMTEEARFELGFNL